MFRLFQMWKVVETADENLKVVKQIYKEKAVDFQQRWEKIRKGKEAVENNKKKFKPFIREKQAKVEDGLARIEKEKNLQHQRGKDLKDLKRDFLIHNLAKVNNFEHMISKFFILTHKFSTAIALSTKIPIRIRQTKIITKNIPTGVSNNPNILLHRIQ